MDRPEIFNRKPLFAGFGSDVRIPISYGILFLIGRQRTPWNRVETMGELEYFVKPATPILTVLRD
jgi:hypothetical protein